MSQSPDPWERTKELLKSLFQQPTYDTWVAPMTLMMIRDNRMVIGMTDPMGIKVMRNRYYGKMQAAVSQAYGRDMDLYFVDAAGQLPSEFLGQQEDGAHTLNPKYTFDTFVVGDGNRFAHAASLAVAEVPNDAYNPLFLYGGVGLGKTHLMHAIGHYMLRENPECRLLYVTSECFMNELISAIQNKTNAAMREKYRNVDVLMVDDIQFIAGKTSTQEEFFHTFNQLHGAGKQIVISSDRPPKEIPTLEERLRSRFEWGLIADIQRPDYETRVAILRKKALIEHIEVPDEVISFIAEKVESNIRELEGSLTRVTAKSMLSGKPITLDMARESLTTLFGSAPEKRVTVDMIMQAVAQYYHLDRMDLTSQRRNREISVPRQIAMYLTREMTNLSTTRIGDAFGGRDHTTVMHGCDKIAAQSREDPALGKTLTELKTAIKG